MAAGDITSQLSTSSDFKAACFDGVDDYVEIPHHASQLGANLSNGFTISAWINPKSIGENSAGSILYKLNGSTFLNGFFYAIRPSNKIGFRLNGGTDVQSTNSVTLSTWTHVLVTVSSSQICTHYFNNVISVTPTDLIQTISTITSTNNPTIGNNCNVTNRTFDGCIKDVKMWNRVLTASEIALDYAGTRVTDGLILDVPLQTDYNDKSTHALTGTNSGTYLTNTLSNNLTADMKGLNLAAATDKLIAVSVPGRDQVVKIIKAERAAA